MPKREVGNYSIFTTTQLSNLKTIIVFGIAMGLLNPCGYVCNMKGYAVFLCVSCPKLMNSIQFIYQDSCSCE
jgi:predicted patatin/cPLA2 family phospholipase